MTGMGGGGGNSSIVLQAFQNALLRQGSLLLIVALVLFVAWNGLRSFQYRQMVRARSGSDGGAGQLAVDRPGSHLATLGTEPVARRVARIGFGAFWIFDGLLQVQSGMPLGLPTNVLQPAAATSPGWVQGIVNFGVTLWTRHPVTAAAATVWIQVGIGLLLIVAPRGRWSELAGLASLLWGMVVWIFGNAFGAIFAPGLTFLFGAPGAVLFYAIAGGLVALPERVWRTERPGRYLLVGMGVFLLVMAGLQAFPGRGFWQGSLGGEPGTLVAMTRTMAATPQPHATSALVSWFSRLAEHHAVLVNLVATAIMAVVGGAFVAGRRLRTALGLLAVFCVFDWVFVENFGFLGGTGTDPNSMLPFLLLALVAVLAATRWSGGGEPAPKATPATPADGPGGVRRSWWQKVDTSWAGRLAAMVGAIVMILVGSAPMAVAALNPQADPIVIEAANGVPEVANGPAPGFSLVDQHGRPVSLASFRGSTVVLTFLDPVCVNDCPTIAQELLVANEQLGPDAANVKFVAVATNPVYHSITTVNQFNRQENLENVGNWYFLTGTLSELQSVWNAYNAGGTVLPGGSMILHSDVVYIIDSSGQIRSIVNSNPGAATNGVLPSSFSNLVDQQVRAVQKS
jgi:cytochrome oxidase Cu insertion factor (SCO1/SenC/PrrC family)